MYSFSYILGLHSYDNIAQSTSTTSTALATSSLVNTGSCQALLQLLRPLLLCDLIDPHKTLNDPVPLCDRVVACWPSAPVSFFCSPCSLVMVAWPKLCVAGKCNENYTQALGKCRRTRSREVDLQHLVTRCEVIKVADKFGILQRAKFTQRNVVKK